MAGGFPRLGITPWRSPEEDRRSELAAEATLAEELGYRSFWLPESHFVPGARPAPLLELAHVAAVTSKLDLGTTSLLLPVRDPLLLAEEIATLDRLSDGRLVVGVGRGFRRELFRVLGVDPSRKRDLLEESLRRMRSAWAGEPVAGEDGPVLVPRPVQDPHPPLWMAAFGPKALRQAAALGMPYLASPLESVGQLADNRSLLERFAAELGVSAAQRRPVMRTVFVGDLARVRAVRRSLEREAESWGRRAAPVLRRSLAEPVEERAILGRPEEVAEGIAGLVDRLGVTDLIVRAHVPGQPAEAVEESVRAIAELGGSA